jgi:exosortase A-associated hydrolase 2
MPSGNETIVFVPPFGEEMNKARRMIARQAQAFAEIGYRVLVPDLLGTGDSEGEFVEATWSAWKQDIHAVLTAFEVQSDCRCWLWGLRLGVALALDAITATDIRPFGVLAWAPVIRGNVFFNQLLRMRVMASKLSDSVVKETASDLRALLERDGQIEIGGYAISARLAREIESVDLVRNATGAGLPLYWYEMTARPDSPEPPAIKSCIEELNRSDLCPLADRIVGPEFWSTVEISTSDSLIEASLDAVRSSAESP